MFFLGTGKSTVVCALCLGLAGHPKLLGRAFEVWDKLGVVIGGEGGILNPLSSRMMNFLFHSIKAACLAFFCPQPLLPSF